MHDCWHFSGVCVCVCVYLCVCACVVFVCVCVCLCVCVSSNCASISRSKHKNTHAHTHTHAHAQTNSPFPSCLERTDIHRPPCLTFELLFEPQTWRTSYKKCDFISHFLRFKVNLQLERICAEWQVQKNGRGARAYFIMSAPHCRAAHVYFCL